MRWPGSWSAFLVALVLGPRTIDALRVLKFGQNINEYLSEGHQKKQGTPSMGGVLLVLSLLLTLGARAASPRRPCARSAPRWSPSCWSSSPTPGWASWTTS